MKTFKAVRFQIVNENGGVSEYEIEDGVIINKEGSGTGWLLEIIISNEHYETFKSILNNLLGNVVENKQKNRPTIK